MNSAMSAAERRAHWAETLQGEAGHAWDWRGELVELAAVSLDYLGMIVGPEAGTALAPLLPPPLRSSGVTSTDDARARSLQERIRRTDPRTVEAWPIHDTLRQLGLYGLYGVTDAHIALPSRRDRIKALVEEGVAFWSASPFKQAADRLGVDRVGRVIDRVVRVANDRRVLDGDVRDNIHPVALAVLGGVSEGRMRNVMAQGGILEGRRGRVSPESARRWLEGRHACWDSIWHEE